MLFVVINNFCFGAVVAVAGHRLVGGVINDRLFNPFQFESNRMGILRLFVGEIDSPANNGPGYNSPAVGIVDLEADGQGSVSHTFLLLSRLLGGSVWIDYSTPKWIFGYRMAYYCDDAGDMHYSPSSPNHTAHGTQHIPHTVTLPCKMPHAPNWIRLFVACLAVVMNHDSISSDHYNYLSYLFSICSRCNFTNVFDENDRWQNKNNAHEKKIFTSAQLYDALPRVRIICANSRAERTNQPGSNAQISSGVLYPQPVH